MVLGLASYHKVKDDPHAKAVLQCLTLGKTLLFVGCGETVLDPNFQQLIAWGSEALKDGVPRHKLLCRASELVAYQQQLNAAPWLQPITYGDDYAALGPFLRSLLPDGAAAAAPAGIRPAPPPAWISRATARRWPGTTKLCARAPWRSLRTAGRRIQRFKPFSMSYKSVAHAHD